VTAAETSWIECEMVCDRAPHPLRLNLRLYRPATIASAVQAARALLPDETIDWEGAPVGVWGQECARGRELQPGDRVELYRRLPVDPREARRRRSARARR
jgi:hypothetical protein